MGGSIYTSNTLHHLKELGLNLQRAHKTALKLLAHCALCAKKQIALKVSVWSRGLPATLQIPTNFFSFGGGDSRPFGPMCLLFLNDAGSVLLPACVAFLFFLRMHHDEPGEGTPPRMWACCSARLHRSQIFYRRPALWSPRHL